MSTIEKAAARLAERAGKVNRAPAEQDAEPTPEVLAEPVREPVPVAPASDPVQETVPQGDPVAHELQADADLRPALDAPTRDPSASSAAPAEIHPPISNEVAPSGGDRVTYHEVDLVDLEARGFLTPGAGRTRLAQDMRRIKRPLLLNIHKARQDGESEASRPNLIMLTSALPGEGKTFLSINLAISLAAELDHRVLLVDGDLAKGDVAHQLGIQSDIGLSNLLMQDHYQIEQGVLGTNIEGLSVLPAGRSTENIDELFASRQMAHITKTLANQDQDRTIVFDAPPLLATTEAHVLANVMGQVVLVIEANRTPQSVVYDALEQIEGCPNLSVLLNKTRAARLSGYGYGYGYGYGSSPYAPREAADPSDRKESA